MIEKELSQLNLISASNAYHTRQSSHHTYFLPKIRLQDLSDEIEVCQRQNSFLQYQLALKKCQNIPLIQQEFFSFVTLLESTDFALHNHNKIPLSKVAFERFHSNAG